MCAVVESAEELFVEVANRYLDVYRVFGRHLNVWTLFFDAGSPPLELTALLVAPVAQIMDLLQTTLKRIAKARGGNDATVPGLTLPMLWATLNGLADHFTGSRQLLHPYRWDELVAFTARTLAHGMADADATIET